MSLTTPPGLPVQVFGCNSAEDHSETVCTEALEYNFCYCQTHQSGGKGGKDSHTSSHPHTLTPSHTQTFRVTPLCNDVRE